jgi:hypothetical protein
MPLDAATGQVFTIHPVLPHRTPGSSILTKKLSCGVDWFSSCVGHWKPKPIESYVLLRICGFTVSTPTIMSTASFFSVPYLLFTLEIYSSRTKTHNAQRNTPQLTTTKKIKKMENTRRKMLLSLSMAGQQYPP